MTKIFDEIYQKISNSAHLTAAQKAESLAKIANTEQQYFANLIAYSQTRAGAEDPSVAEEIHRLISKQ